MKVLVLTPASMLGQLWMEGLVLHGQVGTLSLAANGLRRLLTVALSMAIRVGLSRG